MTYQHFSSARCPQEDSVVKAARTGLWNELIREHLLKCSLCREVAAAAGLMRELANSSAEDGPLPQASLLWWKYELAQRYARSERAQRPIRVMEGLSAGLLLLATWVAMTWLTDSASGVAARMLGRAVPRFLLAMLWELINAGGGLVPFALLPAIVTLGVAAGLLYPLLREE